MTSHSFLLLRGSILAPEKVDRITEGISRILFPVTPTRDFGHPLFQSLEFSLMFELDVSISSLPAIAFELVPPVVELWF